MNTFHQAQKQPGRIFHQKLSCLGRGRSLHASPSPLASGASSSAKTAAAAQNKQDHSSSSTSNVDESIQSPDSQPERSEASGATKKKKKTMEELDEEVRLKLEGLSGEGGASGVEYENGKAEGLKRGVKENMFRVI